MRKSSKKWISLLLSAALLISMFAIAPFTAAAAGSSTPVGEGDTFLVAGNEAEIFGTGWDATNHENDMTANADGTYTKTYTVTKAYDAVQLKAVRNESDWFGDETDNNVTFNLTGAGTFTVTAAPSDGEFEYVVSVSGDIVEFITDFEYDTVFAVGNGEGWWLNGAAWDPGYVANEMTEIEPDVWEIEFENVPDGFERQIKFAIDGAWTHNFGGAFVDSGVETAADYNGENIFFDTDDICTVKAQLDLRNFDFTTKTGATFTITIDYEGDEPVEEAPLKVVLASNYFPEAENNYYDLSEYEDEGGDVYISVEYKLLAQDKYLVNVDVDEFTYDPAVLEWSEDYNKTGNVVNFFPFAAENGFGPGVFHQTDAGRIVANYSGVDPAAFAYNEDGSAVTVIKAVFKVLDREAGETTVTCNLDTLSLCDLMDEPYAQYRTIENGVINEEAYAMAEYSVEADPASQEPPVIIGDVDDNGVVDINDATMLQRYLAEFSDTGLDLSDDNAFTRADANKDGKVNIRDVSQIQRIIAEYV